MRTNSTTKANMMGLTITDHGGRGDGRHDNSAAFAAAFTRLADCAHATLYLPDGEFGVTQPVYVPNHVSLQLAPATRLFAMPGFTGEAVIIKGEAIAANPDGSENWGRHGYSGQIAGGIIDGGKLPIHGIITRWARRMIIRDLEVFNALAGGIRIAEQGWYEHTLRGVRVQIDFDVTCVANAIGIEVVNGSDNHVSQVLVIGYDVGVKGASGSTCFSQVHVWKGRHRPFKIGFHAGGWNDCYSQCQVDEIADGIGFVVDAPFQRFESCMVQGGYAGMKPAPGSVAPVAFRITPRGTHCTYLGTFINPNDTTPFVAAFEGTLEGATILGTLYNPHAKAGAVSQIPSGTGGASFLPVTGFVGDGLRLPAPSAQPPVATDGGVGELRWSEQDGQAVLYLKTTQGWRAARFQ